MRYYKWGLILFSIVGLLYVLTSAKAATVASPQQWGTAFAKDYNHEATTNRWPYRINTISCTKSPTARGYFDCYVSIKPARGGRVMCGAIVIDTGFDVLDNHEIKCSEIPKAKLVQV